MSLIEDISDAHWGVMKETLGAAIVYSYKSGGDDVESVGVFEELFSRTVEAGGVMRVRRGELTLNRVDVAGAGAFGDSVVVGGEMWKVLGFESGGGGDLVVLNVRREEVVEHSAPGFRR